MIQITFIYLVYCWSESQPLRSFQSVFGCGGKREREWNCILSNLISLKFISLWARKTGNPLRSYKESIYFSSSLNSLWLQYSLSCRSVNWGLILYIHVLTSWCNVSTSAGQQVWLGLCILYLKTIPQIVRGQKVLKQCQWKEKKQYRCAEGDQFKINHFEGLQYYSDNAY